MNEVISKKSVYAQLAKHLEFSALSQESPLLLKQLKSFLTLVTTSQKADFIDGAHIKKLVRERAKHIDKMLIALWQYYALSSQLCLIAVGGYGRGELHPHSDIDLLILSEKEISDQDKLSLQHFITLLWDCQLKVGHAVRNLAECIDLAAKEVTVTTNLMESRLLTGDPTLFQKIKTAITPNKIWDPKSFYEAKISEQKLRYRKFDGTSFDLEPNLKSSPGGLRDIHLISWIVQRVYFPKTFEQLIEQNSITKKEYYSLTKCQLFMWKIRFALHCVTGKAEDRLLFDYQKKTALLMGYKDSKDSLAVEKMMKQYYRSVLIIRNLCDILLQVIEEKTIEKNSHHAVTKINDNYHIVNQRVEITDKKLFLNEPSQMLKIFQYVAQDPQLKGIGASTLRALRAARYKITPSFKNNRDNQILFIEFWHILHTRSRAMFLMKRSGILADYLQAFQQITGQMQYDMFHNYTVDEHTLFLLQNLTDFANPKNNSEFPLCSEIMQRQKYPELIFLAGLFHDIAKGRGGDHSELGAVEVKHFCFKHKMDPEHSAIIEWLVANHLIMSLTAQKRDITDPKVIQNFAQLVGNITRLELLYILTVADIRATSNSLWNSWKDSLLKELFLSTRQYLLGEKKDISEHWKNNRAKAKALLIKDKVCEQLIDKLWQPVDNTYFAKRSPIAIAWHAKKIINSQSGEKITVGIKSMPHRSGTEVFVYTLDKENLFALLTATLNRQNLSIQAANIYTDKSGHCFDSFFVLDTNGKAIKGQLIKNQIKASIKDAIENQVNNIESIDINVQQRSPRQFKYFSIQTTVNFFDDEYTNFTRIELTARDYPGLLATIAKAFKLTGVRLHDARITTLGEKVEDTFIVSHKNNTPISNDNQREKIRQTLIELIG